MSEWNRMASVRLRAVHRDRQAPGRGEGSGPCAKTPDLRSDGLGFQSRPSRLLTFPHSGPLSATPHPGARTWGCGGPALCGQSESQEAGRGRVGGSPHAWGHVEAWPQCGGRRTAECPVLAGPLMSGVALSESVTLCGSRWPHLKVDWDGGLESPDTESLPRAGRPLFRGPAPGPSGTRSCCPGWAESSVRGWLPWRPRLLVAVTHQVLTG